MNRVKKICITAISALILFSHSCMPLAAAEAVRNPFQLSGVELVPGTTEFTVSLQAASPIVLSAFDLSIEYDGEVLEVLSDQSEDYYTAEFAEYYQNGYRSCNNKDNQKVVFAGAKTGAGAFNGTMANVTFRLKESSEEATTVIRLCVNTVGSEVNQDIETLVIANPNIGHRLIVKENDKINGDVNTDGMVDLRDVQLTLRAALRIEILNKQQSEAADFNLNGDADLSDAQTILRKVLKIID